MIIRIAGEGKFDIVSPITIHIIEGDITALEADLKSGFEVNKKLKLDPENLKLSPENSDIFTSLPLTLALKLNQFASIKWLVERGAKIDADKENPDFLSAVRYCGKEVARYIAENGADIHAQNRVKSDAYCEALYGKKFDNLPLIEELGHSVKKYGGKAFRQAVIDRQNRVLDFFIKNGVDINYNKPDQVYPFKPTPLCVAARYVDIKMVKYLVENGADVTIAENDGMRPYSIAVERGDNEMAEYLKALEPPEFHNLQNKLLELKSYKLPRSLLDFLQGENLRLELASSKWTKYVDFFALIDVVEMKIGRQKLLRISRELDNFELTIVWNPKKKCVSCYDPEHKELTDIAPFEEFIKNAAVYMDKVINGDPI
ncbi:MAG: ankyrin repeat domain-containing protein [Helicobacteraceae bacterium]|nr:ankyrin repeat domain-containing protein [Helicobacteraceae bacterium]